MVMSLHGQIGAGDFTLDVALHMTEEIVGLVGQNGTGKSTFLRTIAGLCPLRNGQLQVNGQTFDAPDQNIFVVPELRNIGMVFQNHGLLPFLSAQDNVAFPLVVRGVSRAQARVQAGELMERFGVMGVAQQLASSLSGGQSQRVAIARAFVGNPAFVLLDEPLSAIDEASREAIRNEIRSCITSRGIGAIVVSHDKHDISEMCSRFENYTF